MPSPRLSVVIVAHDSVGDLRRTLPPLHPELAPDDELIVVDSGSRDELAATLDELAPNARLVRAAGNVGFAAGANLGATVAGGELLILLNPDAAVQPGWGRAIRAPWGGEWAGWMALVTMGDGATINTSGGVLHFTGIGWAGQMGKPLSAAPTTPVEVAFLSGACLALPRAYWRALDGFPEHFVMYCEDVDLSLRLRLGGGKLAVVPAARVAHAYEFARGPRKWRHLERNRWATLLRTYPTALLVLVTPALLATEVAVWLAALRGGWLRVKALATLDVARSLPTLIGERRKVQRARQVDAATFAAVLTPELSSPYLGPAARWRPAGTLLRLYWRMVLAMLELPRRDRSK